jgi:hypothetical protein
VLNGLKNAYVGMRWDVFNRVLFLFDSFTQKVSDTYNYKEYVMKILNLTTVVVIGLLSFSANATQYKFIATDKSVETKICVLAGSNDKFGLKRVFRQNRRGSVAIDSRFYANHITCNDMVMAHFAYKYDALDTFAYLNGLTNREDKIPNTNVEIKDIVAVSNLTNEKTKIIYVGSAK